MQIWKEFKEFTIKGNVIDLAVGIIIGGAFNKIVSSLVGDIIMPPISALIKNINLRDIKWVLSRNEAGDPAITLNYGSFLQNVFEFFIIAASVFLLIKFINRVRKQSKQEDAAPSAPTKQEQLLAEIRDLLKSK